MAILTQRSLNLKPLHAALTRFTTRFTTWFVALGDAYSRRDEFERMNALSDTELHTNYGIERRDIAAYIFRDKIA